MLDIEHVQFGVHFHHISCDVHLVNGDLVGQYIILTRLLRNNGFRCDVCLVHRIVQAESTFHVGLACL